MAPTMPSRMSSGSNFCFALNSLRPRATPSRKAERCVPPSPVYWPFTNEK